ETISRDDTRVRLTSDAMVAPRDGLYDLGGEQKDGSWVDRARGVTAMLKREGAAIRGFDAEITSDLPVGAGLGSSAAFAIALLRSLSKLFDLALDDAATAHLAHAAETEYGRVRGAVDAVRARDDVELGQLLNASHRSLRDDYEVSTPELDELTGLAIGAGALGARMVGGGFGGSIIALTRRGRGHDLAAEALARYRDG